MEPWGRSTVGMSLAFRIDCVQSARNLHTSCMERKTKHHIRSEATREQLLAASRPLFGARGYAGVGTEEIVRAAGVTRGALYHQFADKRELFAAVLEAVDADLVAEAMQQTAGVEDPLEA